MASRGAPEWIGMFEGPADLFHYAYTFETRLHTGLGTRLPIQRASDFQRHESDWLNGVVALHR